MNTRSAIVALVLALAGCASEPIPLGSGSASADTAAEDTATASDASPGDDTAGPDSADASREPDVVQDDAAGLEDAPALSTGEPLEPVVVPLWTRAVDFLAVLTDGEVLVHSDGELLGFVPEQDLPIHLGTVAGDPLAATWLDTAALVAGTKGVYVVAGSKLAKSPLSAALGKTTLVHDMAGTPAGDLWIGTVKGLYRWRDDALAPVVPDDLPDRDALLAWGPPHDGAPALWVAAEQSVYAVVESADGALSTWPDRDDLPVSSLAADADGGLWAVSAGTLHRRAPDGEWRAVPLPEVALAVACASGSKAVWILGSTALHRAEGGVLRSTGDLTKSATLLGAGTDGSAVLAGPDGIYRVQPGHLVTLGGLVDGQTLSVTQLVTIHPTPPDSVTGIVADVDGEALPVEMNPWAVALSASVLGDGAHVLTVTASWAGGEQASSSVSFTVESLPIPTWSGDIQPLYQDRCAKCHSAAVTKSPLDTYDLWVARIDAVLENVGNGNMPLPPNPPLTAEDVGRIAAWRDAGFPQ